MMSEGRTKKMIKVIPMSFRSDRVEIEYVRLDGAKSTKLGGSYCPKEDDPNYKCSDCTSISC